MAGLIFDVPYFSIGEPTPELIASHIKDKSPRFGVTMMLARLNVPNSNGHRLMKAEVEKAIEALGDTPLVPGNLDHETMPLGAGYSFWVEEKGRSYPELWMSAAYWKRYISEDKRKEIEASHKSNKLGASWEIDEGHYTLEADKDDSNILDIKDFSIDGFGLMVGKTPAEKKTQGTATITAQEEDAPDGERVNIEHGVIRISSYGDLPVDMLQAIGCPECGSRGRLRKLDFDSGVFELECLNAEYDSSRISHVYEVSVAVKPKGQSAEYVLTATKEVAGKIDGGVKDGTTIPIVLKRTKEVDSMEFTKEQQEAMDAKIEAEVKDRMATYLKDQKDAEEAQAKADAEKETEIEKRVKDAEEKAGKEAVDAYKKAQETAAKRFDELNEIMPYESEEDKVAERVKIAGMADERYDDYKEKRELLAKIAELTKGDDEEEEEEEEETPGGDGVGAGSEMPAGNISAGKDKKAEPDFGALARL
jgi:hypothetical protein